MDDLGKTSRVKGNRPKYKLLLFFLLKPSDFVVDIRHFLRKTPSNAIGNQIHSLYTFSIALIIGFAVQVIQNTHKISKHGIDTVIERFVNIAIHVGEFNAAFDVEEHQLGDVFFALGYLLKIADYGSGIFSDSLLPKNAA